MTGIKKEDKEISKWCDNIASIVADALVDAGLIPPENFDKAVAVTSEEIYVRVFCLNDFPPQSKKNS